MKQTTLWEYYKKYLGELFQWPLNVKECKDIKKAAADLFFHAVFGPLFRLVCTITLPISALVFACGATVLDKRSAAAATKRRAAYYAAYGIEPKHPSTVNVEKCGHWNGIYG